MPPRKKPLLTWATGPDGRPLFGTALRQPAGFNPPPLELRSPTPSKASSSSHHRQPFAAHHAKSRPQPASKSSRTTSVSAGVSPATAAAPYRSSKYSAIRRSPPPRTFRTDTRSPASTSAFRPNS